MNKIKKKTQIAVIAHDGKKADMVAFIMKRLDFFRNVDVIATGTTGKHIEHAGLDVNKSHVITEPAGQSAADKAKSSK